MGVEVEERKIEANGLQTRYLAAGSGPPLVLLHGNGTSAADWSWVLPALARTNRVYAPDLPGFGGGVQPAPCYSPAALAASTSLYLDALGIGNAAVVGHSLGGLVALHLALREPDRVSSLGLVSSAGLGRAVNPALAASVLPGYGEIAVAWSRTPPGNAQRMWLLPLLFARPWRVPRGWLREQSRLAARPGALEAGLAGMRAMIQPPGQREVLLKRLPQLEMPALVIWGACDKIFPATQSRDAARRLPDARLYVIPGCGHLPHVECPDRFSEVLGRFLRETIEPDTAGRP